jgi:hypothetical protein
MLSEISKSSQFWVAMVMYCVITLHKLSYVVGHERESIFFSVCSIYLMSTENTLMLMCEV